MANFNELMDMFSIPRPNGSAAEQRTRQSMDSWLETRGIPHRWHSFRQHPFYFEAIGLWLIVTRIWLAVAIWLRWGWFATGVALVGLLGGLVDMLWHIPLVSWPGSRTGQNLLIDFSPPDPDRELLICAHYDTKTEYLDHRQRMFLLRSLPAGIVFTFIVACLAPLDARLAQIASPWAAPIHLLALALILLILFLALGLGLNLSTGRLLAPSPGAVDNGAACAILLALAERLHLQAGPLLGHTRLTLALFTAEEVQMQGSYAFAHSRTWPLPAAVLNLEALGQDGPYVYWERDGNVLHLIPTNPELNAAISQAVQAISGHPAQPAGPVNSDGASFLEAGLPVAVLGTYHLKWVDTGFHKSSDNLDRITFNRLDEGVRILSQFITAYDQGDPRFLTSQGA